ncbi:MAG: hypothetical protein JXR41_15840 [Bacteroidales bacterium]|nr:hypothetical protein [Bacteroidales bacterium]MBN2764567.1 hypothetical protein [Bacteroidales bacterium]
MENRFEEFVRNKREEFDFREPDPALWKKIETSIKPRRIINWRIIVSRAAAVLIIFAASYVVHELINSDSINLALKKQRQKPSKELLIPELQEAEMYYSGLISQKLQEIEPILLNCPGVEEELKFEMSELDSLYTDLKNDLKDNIANQEVIEAIIENYRLRIDILEELLSELDPEDEICISKINDYEL